MSAAGGTIGHKAQVFEVPATEGTSVFSSVCIHVIHCQTSSWTSWQMGGRPLSGNTQNLSQSDEGSLGSGIEYVAS